jgi:hypothetical protein
MAELVDRGSVGRLLQSGSLTPLLCAAPFAVALALWTGAVQDYRDFVVHWARVLGGGAPHVKSYGPLFNAIAPVSAIHPLAPKLLFVGIWLGAAAWLTRLADRARPGLALGIALFFLNPWFWSEVAVYAHFDVMVAACCLTAVHLVTTRRPAAAGVALSAGVLLKFIPLILLPALLLDPTERRLQLGPMVLVVALCAAGLGIAYSIQGDVVLEPFRYGASRASSGFSPFDYLRGPHSFLLAFTPRPNLDAWSTAAILVCSGITVALALVYRIEAATSALLLALATLTLYRAGHSQFYMIPALLAPYWLVRHPDASPPRWPTVSLALYFSWLLLETVVWVIGAPQLFRSLDGLVHFVVSANLYAALLHDAMARSRGPSLRYRIGW